MKDLKKLNLMQLLLKLLILIRNPLKLLVVNIDRDMKSGKINETNKETSKKIPDDHFIPEDSYGIQDDLLANESLSTSESTSQIKSSANHDSLEVNEP